MGPSISPTIVPVPTAAPTNLRARSGPAGTTSATGFPWRVIRSGWRVLCTSAINPRHLALNSEMETWFIMTIMLTIVTKQVKQCQRCGFSSVHVLFVAAGANLVGDVSPDGRRDYL